MKTLTAYLSVLALIVGMIFISSGSVLAQTCDSTRAGFVDRNGDGFNDNAPDHDGDGIPNGHDPDWIMNPQDGTGYQHKNGQGGIDKAATKDAGTPAVQNREQKKLGSALGAGSQYHHQNQNKVGPVDGTGNQFQNQTKNKYENGTLTRTQTKAQLKQKFQSKAQAFARTQTMSQVRQQLRDGSCGDGASSGGAGSGTGSGSGVCDGTGPKGNGKGGNK